MTRVAVGLATMLIATTASAQLPPWAGCPIDPPPSFLVVPPAPETEEPEEVRVMRDEYRAARDAFRQLARRLRSHARRVDYESLVADSYSDPSALVPTRQEMRALARSLTDRDTYGDEMTADAILARAAEPTRVSQLDVVQQELLLHIARRLRERFEYELAVEVGDAIIARWSCTRWARRAAAFVQTICGDRWIDEVAVCVDGRSRREELSSQLACDDRNVQQRAQWRACSALADQALGVHQQAFHDRVDGRLDATVEGYASAIEGYRRVFTECVSPTASPDGYWLAYDLADALFWAEEYEDAVVAFTEVRDWSWSHGQSPRVGEYAARAARRVGESRQHLLDEAIVARHELTLPSPSPTPTTPPSLVAELILAREIYLARFPDDPEHVRDAFLLGNAQLLERYGYWDEARARYAEIPDDPLARAGIVRMAMALGDSAEVARVASLPHAP
jgi:hypothetical protein